MPINFTFQAVSRLRFAIDIIIASDLVKVKFGAAVTLVSQKITIIRISVDLNGLISIRTRIWMKQVNCCLICYRFCWYKCAWSHGNRTILLVCCNYRIATATF